MISIKPLSGRQMRRRIVVTLPSLFDKNYQTGAAKGKLLSWQHTFLTSRFDRTCRLRLAWNFLATI
jgi:hypothetical protein